MQLKHPELLWALLLLLIPIIIHLFQLRKFKRTPFTNVAMLQRVESKSRKSKRLKKWLLLFARLGLLGCIILAFAQPFFANKTALTKKETVIYVDDSFSMQAKAAGSKLLETAVQELVTTLPDDRKYHFITNTKTIRNATVKEVKNRLLGWETQQRQISLQEILIKAQALLTKDKSVQKEVIVISDFQKEAFEASLDSLQDVQLHLVQISPDKQENISIDSLYLGEKVNQQLELMVKISGLSQEGQLNLPIALYNNNTLIAKTAVEPLSGSLGEALLSIPVDQPIKGKLTIDDNSLTFDNQLFFNIEKRPLIKVLAIDDGTSDYLKRLFDNEEFEFATTPLARLNYGSISKQNLIVLNEIERLPNSLVDVLVAHQKNGGVLAVVPPTQIDQPSYDTLLIATLNSRIQQEVKIPQNVTGISFGHPLYQNVFEERVTNFDYPQVSLSYTLSGNAPKVLKFANDNGFLVNKGNTYFFTGSLNLDNSNFTASPLIVPTFYNMAQSSLKQGDLYHTIGTNSSIDIAKTLDRDDIITLVSTSYKFVPLQQNLNTKTRLSFFENPETAGIYAAVHEKDTIRHIAFNHQRKESLLEYQSLENLNATTKNNSITTLFDNLSRNNEITNYWKWFVIFALAFLVFELLIQKFIS